MWFTALLPPPPTPITFIVLDCDFGMSNKMLSNSVLIITFLLCCLFFTNYSALSKNSFNPSVNFSKKDFFLVLGFVSTEGSFDSS